MELQSFEYRSQIREYETRDRRGSLSNIVRSLYGHSCVLRSVDMMKNQLAFSFESIREHQLFEDLSPKVVNEFWKFHSENPQIYDLFKKYSDQLVAAGRKRYGISTIVQRIRWHVNVDTRGEEFKINNNHGACYARLLMIENERLAGLFQTRRSPGWVRGEKNA